MECNDEDKIKATLLYHLRRKKIIGGVHTHFDTLLRGFPAHFGKDVKKIAQSLIRSGLLVTKPTSYGLQVSLNLSKIREIDECIFRILGFRFES